jgi:hypothetical protein
MKRSIKKINLGLVIIVLLGFFPFFGMDVIKHLSIKYKSQLPLSSIENMAIDSNGNIYISLAQYGVIQVYDSTGQFKTFWDVETIGGLFRVDIKTNDLIAIYPARLEKKYVYSTTGRFISLQSAPESDSIFRIRRKYSLDRFGNQYRIVGFYPTIQKNNENIVNQKFIIKLIGCPQSLLYSFFAFIFLILLNKQVRKNRKRYPNYFVYIYERLLKK